MKKRKIPVLLCTIIATFLLSSAIPFLLGESVSARHFEDVAVETTADITRNCTFDVSENKESLAKLTDASVSTDWTAANAAYIDIRTTQRIGSLYIEWTSLPAAWTLSVWKKDKFIPYKAGGTNGFINEFITIEASCTRIRILWEKGSAKVSIGRITVFSPGKAPDGIQQWKPSCTKADLLLISTHADDEHLYFGGTLSTYAGELKKNVQVAYLINCGILRTRELLAGLWVVGVTNYPVISDFPDQYVANLNAASDFYGYRKVLEYQVMLLRRFKPDVAVGHDLNGEYGHGAHMLNAKTLTEAIEAAQDPLQFPDTAKQYGTWAIKKLYLHLYDKNTVIMDWTLPLSAFDGKSSWEMAQLGYAQHVSQHQFKFRVRIEGPNDCRKFGLFYTSVGADVLKNDFFENIPASPAVIIHDPTSDSRMDPGGSSPGAEISDGASSALSGTQEGNGRFHFGIGAGSVIFLVLILYLLFVRRNRRRKRRKRPVIRKIR